MYSQNDEESVIARWTPERGKFLEIGAWHAKLLSNTRALYESGWSGVMVEPSPGPMRGLLDEYGNDDRIELVQAAVSGQGGLTLLRVTDLPVSTDHADTFNIWKDEGQYFGLMWVPTISVFDLISQFGPFQFVSIDAEGGSVDLFMALLESPMKPECICVEHDGRGEEIMKAARRAGYSRHHSTSENLVFAR